MFHSRAQCHEVAEILGYERNGLITGPDCVVTFHYDPYHAPSIWLMLTTSRKHFGELQKKSQYLRRGWPFSGFRRGHWAPSAKSSMNRHQPKQTQLCPHICSIQPTTRPFASWHDNRKVLCIVCWSEIFRGIGPFLGGSSRTADHVTLYS